MSVSTNINIAPFKAGHWKVWTLMTIHGHTYLWFDVNAAVQYCPYVHALIFQIIKDVGKHCKISNPLCIEHGYCV